MGFALQDDVSLAALSDTAVLRRRGVPVEHRLPLYDALALSLLDGLGDPGRASATLQASFAEHVGRNRIERVIHRYWPFLRDRGADALPAAPDLAWLRALSRSGRAYAAPHARAAAPEALTWLVTLGCNRRCPYCFYDVFSHPSDGGTPPDALLSLERAVALVHEMGALGAADLYLTGGEPLLRADLLEVIREATRARVRTHLVTKYQVTPALARSLAEAGLWHVTVSLDDARPREADVHAGAKGYFGQATTAIRSLVEQGLALTVNCVVTGVNERELESLASLLVGLGVRRLTLGRLSPPAVPRARPLRLWPEIEFETRLAELRERFAGVLEITSSSSGVASEHDGSPEASGGDRACAASTVCDVGISALDVLPDGSVTRCRYLPGRGELVVGSLQRKSLLEIWESPELMQLVKPSAEHYAGSDCAGCGGFAACHERGRCFFTALAKSQRLFAPDAFCRR